ncbi:hypothetical protein FHG66_20275 [Rubellimicrobium rubrum]|uniref:Lysozyme inhibitor n=1 Tax=Rubellimicrobium rubrum TaxID=2585369 RepID=A0A5C4MPG8_9RHOB|nr:hypothetical protein [Rubellimicrobium rubrum]TNC45132.1 hypothetical protein FHG66_20275 [Rubellimicrobium rubrum]
MTIKRTWLLAALSTTLLAGCGGDALKGKSYSNCGFYQKLTFDGEGRLRAEFLARTVELPYEIRDDGTIAVRGETATEIWKIVDGENLDIDGMFDICKPDPS